MYSIEMLLETGKKKYSIYLILVSFGLLTFHSSVWLAHFVFYAPYILEIILDKIKINNFVEKTEKIEIVNRDKNIIKLFFITIGISLFTGLCTPLKLTPFTYIFKVIGGYSSEIIAELQRRTIGETPQLMIIVGAALVILSISKTKIKLTDICLISGLIIMSGLAIRNMYIALIVFSFPIARIITNFIQTYDKKEIFDKIDEIFNKNYAMLIIIFLIVIALSIDNYKEIYKEEYVFESKYPIEATKYIKENINTKKMRLYNSFNIGAYLEFNGIKTFIDSRSEVYCKEFNNVTILEDFAKFNKFLTIEPDEMIEKYGITHFLFDTKNENVSKMKEDERYNVIYEDSYFIIFEVSNIDI